MTGHITDETLREIALAVGPDWQAGRNEPRDPEAALVTPSLDEMAAAPGATQAQFRVTYARVGRHGGRSGRPAPAPLECWAIGADGLAERIAKDVRPYLASSDVEVHVDLEQMTGFIFAGMNNGGSFTVEQLAVAEGRDA
ncbi:hypothetical protein [Streptomyces swartbergensis]|uniref:Uncharacterized protein n=1 Tax=Streptomyces swartbergensis TaxID=487165 RepID=A0A243RSG2_9ACTN|nr:hypothetical protein [Streptomyces swartbergensis]OUC97829.1 hypothetical protein CA983_30040 [Streptomyces swartbergensis]